MSGKRLEDISHLIFILNRNLNLQILRKSSGKGEVSKYFHGFSKHRLVYTIRNTALVYVILNDF